MNIERKGFVGRFKEPLGPENIVEIVEFWLAHFGSVEQTIGQGGQVLTQSVRTIDDVVWEDNLQFRILAGEQFSWVYLSESSYVIETSGLALGNGALLCRDVLTDLPGCIEIIDDNNDRRLDQLEAEGLM